VIELINHHPALWAPLLRKEGRNPIQKIKNPSKKEEFFIRTIEVNITIA